jgi:hypothetical protein
VVARCALGALIMLWAGILIGVSLLAAPAKFNAATLTLPVAMDVGRQEFGALNRAEIVLAALALALAACARARRTIWLGLAIAAGVIALQGLWLLPVLEARAEMIIQAGRRRARPGTRSTSPSRC